MRPVLVLSGQTRRHQMNQLQVPHCSTNTGCTAGPDDWLGNPPIIFIYAVLRCFWFYYGPWRQSTVSLLRPISDAPLYPDGDCWASSGIRRASTFLAWNFIYNHDILNATRQRRVGIIFGFVTAAWSNPSAPHLLEHPVRSTFKKFLRCYE